MNEFAKELGKIAGRLRGTAPANESLLLQSSDDSSVGSV
jgi:hypothetical protein